MLKRARQQPEKYLWLTRLLPVNRSEWWRWHSPTRWRASPGRCWPKAAPIACQYLRQRRKASVDGRMRFASVCSRTAGVMTTLMRNGRDRRSGKPVKGQAILERALLVGTRSADHIRASGHNGCIATGQASTRKQAGYMAAPDASQNARFILHRGRRPYMALFGRAGR